MDGLSFAGHEIPESELIETFTTPGGPGGQHANRNETAVSLRLDVGASSLAPDVKDRIISRLGTTVEVVASDSRSQWRNRAIARRRLANRLAGALAEAPARKPTKPTRASRRRRLEEKRAHSEKKQGRRPPEPD
jgi:ribosome-associated protein